jgi:hypothetical protein
MNWKEHYTRIFLCQIGESVSDSNIKSYIPLWWKNTRDKGQNGLRLTDAGFEMIKQIELKTYEIGIPKEMPITTQVIIFLDHFIDCPYYLTKNSIIVTSERKAVELTLFSGDLRKYGLAKAMTKTRKVSESS